MTKAKKKTTASTKRRGKVPLVTKQPRSKQAAAEKNGMFLYTNDSWSTRCFDPNDLHFLDREVFG